MQRLVHASRTPQEQFFGGKDQIATGFAVCPVYRAQEPLARGAGQGMPFHPTMQLLILPFSPSWGAVNQSLRCPSPGRK